MIIDRYLIREVLKPFGVVLAVLTILITSYGAARFLSHAVNGLLPTGMMVQLVGLRTLIALDVLIPISLYLSVVLAFGRLYADSEITAMAAAGVGQARAMRVVLILSSGVALLVGGLSLYVRPWAYQRSHELADRAAASLNTDNMTAGTFYVDRRASRTIFIGRRAGPEAPGHDVLVQLQVPGGTRIIHAQTVERTVKAGARHGAEIHLTDAHVYDLRHDGEGRDLVMNVKHLDLRLANPQVRPPQYSSVAAGTARLAASRSAEDVAELEWRLTTGFSTLLLGLLGVLLSRTRTREHKHARLGIAILSYAGYYFWYESVRTWVQNGVIPALPGVWWAPASLAAVLLAAWLGPSVRPWLRSA